MFFILEGFLDFSFRVVIGFILREFLLGDIIGIDDKGDIVFDNESLGKSEINGGFVGYGSHFFVFGIHFGSVFLLNDGITYWSM